MTAISPRAVSRLPEAFSGEESAAGYLEFSREAGENLAIGTPVYVSGNKYYAADNVTNYKVVGIIKETVLMGFLATAVLSGPITLSGLSDGSTYFLDNEIIANAAPASGMIIELGKAVSSTILIVGIKISVLLS